jgi:PKD repeat protein
MKVSTRILSSTFLLCWILVFSSTMSLSQVLINEGFNGYDPLIPSTAPAGWVISVHDSYNTSFVTSVSGFPCYKFGVTGATITSPSFTNADSVTFWLRGANTDNLSALIILETANGTTWDTVTKLNPISNSSTTLRFALKNTSIKVSFVYIKSTGNCGIDDIKIFRNTVSTVAAFNFFNTCEGSYTQFNDQSGITGGVATLVSWSWNFGDGNSSTQQSPSHLYSNPGSYPVKLVATNSAGHSDSITKTVVISPTPNVVFSQAIANLTINLTNYTTISSGTISGYSWDFGDGGTSTASSPLHTYAAPGSYTICLTATSSAGCINTQCLPVLITSIKQTDILKNTASAFPNPNNGLFTVAVQNPKISTSIKVYDMIGNRISDIQVKPLSNGNVQVDMQSLENGIYFVRIENGNNLSTKRINLSR